MHEIKNVLNKIKCEEVVLLIVLILSGGFNEYINCFLSVVISTLLILKLFKHKEFIININFVSLSVTILVFGYLLSTFYAVDSGMAFLGFLKFLPVLLFLLLLFQDDSCKERCISILPYFALILGFISVILMFVPEISKYFNVDGRLAGFFQYPNTFALFLLVGELIILSKDRYKRFNVITMIILAFLIILTQSRAVFILAVASNSTMIFFKKGKKNKIVILSIIIVLILFVILAYPILISNKCVDRFLSLSITESTLAGRLLYYFDALPVILKHPFGLGNMGYYYIQQSIQTGVYSVKYIHNDLMQILLDIGWIPFAVFLIGIARSIFSRAVSIEQKIILIAIVLHCMFDFDLQFTAMFFVLLLFLDYTSGKRVVISKHNILIGTSICLCGLVSLYFATALAFSYYGNYKVSDYMYPPNTENQIELLLNENNKNQVQTADKIIAHNKYVQVAYSTKARYAYSKGDFEELMKYKNKIFKIAPFSYEEYEEYCYMLIQGIYLYQQVQDEYSIVICKQELINTAERLHKLEDRLSTLGKIIEDQPQTELPDDIAKLIDAIDYSDKK